MTWIGYEVHGLESWTLFGSVDGEKWQVLDSVDDCATRRVVESVNGFTGRFFRIAQARGLTSVEFYSLEYPDGVCKGLGNLMEITASNNHLHRMASPRHKGMWYSANEEGSWIQFELVDCSIVPELYTIKCGKFWLLKSWELYGSMNGIDWDLLDRKIDSRFSESYAYGSWELGTTLECKFLRIKQFGTTRDGVRILCLSGVGFFGAVKTLKKGGEPERTVARVIEFRGVGAPREDREDEVELLRIEREEGEVELQERPVDQGFDEEEEIAKEYVS
jgi:hypothetical protein